MLAEPNAFDRGGQGEHQDPLSGGGDERLEAHGSFKKTGSWRREPRLDMLVELNPLEAVVKKRCRSRSRALLAEEGPPVIADRPCRQ